MAEILSKISPKHKGVLCIISSAFCFAFMGAFVRLPGDLPSVQKSFFRNLVAFIFAAAILMPQKKSNIGALLIRSVCGTLGILCNFYAVDHLALSDAAMLNKMSPFFVIVFSTLLLALQTQNLPACLTCRLPCCKRRFTAQDFRGQALKLIF